MEKEYLSIKEFADRANVSQQSIYKRIANKNDSLYPFLKIINRKKYICVSALLSIYNIDNENPQPKQEDKNIIEILEKEIESKNKQIETLLNQLTEAHTLINQQQQLHLLDKQKIKELEESQTETKRKGIFNIFKRK